MQRSDSRAAGRGRAADDTGPWAGRRSSRVDLDDVVFRARDEGLDLDELIAAPAPGSAYPRRAPSPRLLATRPGRHQALDVGGGDVEVRVSVAAPCEMAATPPMTTKPRPARARAASRSAGAGASSSWSCRLWGAGRERADTEVDRGLPRARSACGRVPWVVGVAQYGVSRAGPIGRVRGGTTGASSRTRPTPYWS